MACAGSFQRIRSSFSILTAFTTTRATSTRLTHSCRNDGLAKERLREESEDTTLMRSSRSGMGRRRAWERTWRLWSCAYCSAGCCGVFAFQRFLGLLMRVGTEESRIGALYTVVHFWSVYRLGSEFLDANIGAPARKCISKIVDIYKTQSRALTVASIENCMPSEQVRNTHQSLSSILCFFFSCASSSSLHASSAMAATASCLVGMWWKPLRWMFQRILRL